MMTKKQFCLLDTPLYGLKTVESKEKIFGIDKDYIYIATLHKKGIKYVKIRRTSNES